METSESLKEAGKRTLPISGEKKEKEKKIATYIDKTEMPR